MLFDEHLNKNSKEEFLILFNKILDDEIIKKNKPSLQDVQEKYIKPQITKLVKQKKEKTKEERRKNPKLNHHRLVGKKKV